jgi:hypothetical protein
VASTSIRQRKSRRPVPGLDPRLLMDTRARRELVAAIADAHRQARQEHREFKRESAAIRAELKPSISDADWHEASERLLLKQFVSCLWPKADDDMLAEALLPDVPAHLARNRIQKIRLSCKQT